jgi:OmpA-OmpF porin, OOP family
VRGVITARGNDSTVAIRADDASNLIVVLTDATTIKRTDGFRELTTSASDLIPGLRVHLEGERQGGNRFVAERIRYTRDDLKIAFAIRGGVDATDRRSLENQQRIADHAQTLEQQRLTLEDQARGIVSNAEQIVGTTGAIAEANARITNLADHTSVATLTVYFRNGSARISAKDQAALQTFAAQARNIPGYVVQVQGFASAVGPEALNQSLSTHRAEAVAAVLSQSGVPPTHMLVPAAMGTTQQVGSNKTAKGQAENRRTVVTLLQNKGISGR